VSLCPRSPTKFVGSREQHRELAAEITPGLVAGPALGNQHGAHHTSMLPFEQLPVAQHLAEAETKLSLFILGRRALDLRDRDRIACFPRKIEVRLVGARRTRRDRR